VSLISNDNPDSDSYYINPKQLRINTVNQVDYLIITSEAFIEYLEPLSIWKQQRGLRSKIVSVETIYTAYEGRDNAEKIQNCVKDCYEKNLTEWILLAGDTSYVPTRRIKIGNSFECSCDQYYITPDNWIFNNDETVSIIDYFDWNVNQFIGRLPASSTGEMISLVDRLITYERNPPIGSWMTHALFGGAFANFDSDSNHNDVFDEGDWPEFDANENHNWIKNNILPDYWTSTLLGEVEGEKITDFSYDRALTEENIVTEINNGVSIGMFDSHGSPTSMHRLIFENDVDGDSLFDSGQDSYASQNLVSTDVIFDPKSMLGLFFLCACSTGSFAGSETCLTEYFVKNVGIGCIGSSNSAYYDSTSPEDHGGWLTQGLSSRFWKAFFSQSNHPGQALILAKQEYVNDFNTLGGKTENRNQTLIQYNLMGDPEVPIWSKIPQRLSCSLNMNTSTLTVLDSDRAPVEDVTITLTDDLSSIFWEGTTDEKGRITLPTLSKSNITLTASKSEFIPYQESISRIPAITSSHSTPSFIYFSLLLFFLLIFLRKKK
jgi:hypothetical protein